MPIGQMYYDVLLWLFEALGAEPSPLELRRAVGNALSIEDAELIEDWRDWLRIMSAPLGLHVLPVSASLDDLRVDTRRFPLLTQVESAQGKTWIGVWGRERGKFRVTRIAPDMEECWLSEAELLHWLAASRSESVAWVTVESMAPLSSWKEDKSADDSISSGIVWHRLVGLLRAEKKELWTIVVYAIAIGLMTLVTPVAVQALVNTVAFGTLLQPLVVLSLMLAVGLVFLAMMQALQAYLAEMISRRVFVRVVGDFAYRFPRAKQTALESHDQTELANYFFDVLTVQKVLAVLLLEGLSAVLIIISGLMLLAVYHPVLLAFDVFLLIGIGLIIRVLGRGALASSSKESKYKHKTAAWLGRVAHHNVLFRGHGGPDLAQAHADSLSRQYIQARSKHFRVVLRQLGGGLLLQVLASTGLLLVGGWLVISQQLTLGQLVASELVVSVVLLSLLKIVKSFEKFYDLTASLEKLGKVIDLELERNDGQPMLPTSQAASLRLVDISYHLPHGEVILDHLGMELSPGQTLALTGLPGIGRSILGDILFGLRKPSQGQFYFNQRLIQDTRLEDIRRMIALVRDVCLLPGSILENVHLARTEASRSAVRKALAMSGLLPYVLSLPDGIHTQLDHAYLTPLQERQLMLARAFAGQPSLIVIDGLLDTFRDDVLAHVLQQFHEQPGTRPTLLLLTNHPQILDWCEYSIDLHAPAPPPAEVAESFPVGQELP